MVPLVLDLGCFNALHIFVFICFSCCCRQVICHHGLLLLCHIYHPRPVWPQVCPPPATSPAPYRAVQAASTASTTATTNPLQVLEDTFPDHTPLQPTAFSQERVKYDALMRLERKFFSDCGWLGVGVGGWGLMKGGGWLRSGWR